MKVSMISSGTVNCYDLLPISIIKRNNKFYLEIAKKKYVIFYYQNHVTSKF